MSAVGRLPHSLPVFREGNENVAFKFSIELARNNVNAWVAEDKKKNLLHVLYRGNLLRSYDLDFVANGLKDSDWIRLALVEIKKSMRSVDRMDWLL